MAIRQPEGLPAYPPQVGTADPERKNSTIQTDPDQSFELLREQVGDEAAGCALGSRRRHIRHFRQLEDDLRLARIIRRHRRAHKDER